jgi:mRNA interferase RelE/StbE
MSSDQRTNFDLVPTKTFVRDLERLDKATNQRIISSLEDLRRDPYLGKPLRGELRGLLSFRIGEYRVIYSLRQQSHEILLYAAKHRSKVYEH